MLQAVDKRTPRVSLEIDLWGSISECISVLKTVSCLRACHLNLQQSITPLSDGHAIPEENFSVECLQNQTTFDSISLSVPNEWPTVSPKGTLGFHPLQLKEIEIEFAVKVRPAARGFVDGKNLEILSIYGFDLITSFLEGFENKLPSLKTVRFFPSKHHGVTGQFEEFVHDSHYTQIMGFFSKTALQEIGLHNFTQKMPWLDMLSVSAYSLRQLTIHTKSSCWESVRTVDPNVPRQPPELINSPNKAHLQVHPKPVLTAAELYRLASLCPNLERLGFDVHAMTVKQAVSLPCGVKYQLLTRT